MPRYMPAELFTQAALTVAYLRTRDRMDMAAPLADAYSTYADADLASKLEESADLLPEVLAAFHKGIEEDPGSLPAYMLIYLKAMERFQPTGQKRSRFPVFNGTWFRFQRQPPTNYAAQSTATLLRYCAAVREGAIDFDTVRELVRSEQTSLQ